MSREFGSVRYSSYQLHYPLPKTSRWRKFPSCVWIQGIRCMLFHCILTGPADASQEVKARCPPRTACISWCGLLCGWSTQNGTTTADPKRHVDDFLQNRLRRKWCLWKGCIHLIPPVWVGGPEPQASFRGPEIACYLALVRVFHLLPPIHKFLFLSNFSVTWRVPIPLSSAVLCHPKRNRVGVFLTFRFYAIHCDKPSGYAWSIATQPSAVWETRGA